MKTAMLHQVAEIQLSYRNRVPASMRPQVDSSRKAYELAMENWDEERIDFVEQFKVLLLNRACHVLGISEIASGSVGGVLIDPRLVYVTALKSNASGIILLHNHPSGNLKPSRADIRITLDLIKGASCLNILIHDHIIVTSEGYYSLAENGHM